jgi:hypothetical protein
MVLESQLPHKIIELLFTLIEASGSRKSTPPQNRQLVVSISKSKQYVDDCEGELTL